MPKKILWIGLILLYSSCFAGQKKSIQEGGSVTLQLSSKDPNLISVTEDRIQKFSTIKGALTAQLDPKSGALMLKPTALYSEKPFSMLLFTEKGHHYTLLVVPVKIPAQDIVLMDEGALVSPNMSVQAPYTHLITALIGQMVKNETSVGYRLEDLQDVQKDYPQGRWMGVVAYVGPGFKGEIATYQNTSNAIVHLKEKDFVEPLVVAVALSQTTLKPFEMIRVYRVVRHG